MTVDDLPQTHIQRRQDYRFELGQVVNVPPNVHANQTATVAGREWGPDKLKPIPGWVYYLAFCYGGQAWEATEEELIAWQQ